MTGEVRPHIKAALVGADSSLRSAGSKTLASTPSTKKKIRRRLEMGSLTHDIARLHRMAVDRVLQPFKLTRALLRILVSLKASDGPSQSDLARRLGISRHAIGVLLARLQRRGLIERRPDASDARLRHAVITPAGLSLLSDIDKQVDAVDRLIVSRISREDIKCTSAVLELVKAEMIRMADTDF